MPLVSKNCGESCKRNDFSTFIISWPESQLTFTCSKSTIKTLQTGVFIVNFEYIVFSSVSTVDFEQVNVRCNMCLN